MIPRIFIDVLLITIMALSTSIAYTGRVLDKAGVPVSGAKVAILNTVLSTQTSTDGTFSIGATGILKQNFMDRSVGFKVVTAGAIMTIQLENPGVPVRVMLYTIDGRVIGNAVCGAGLPEAVFPEIRGLSFLKISGAEGSDVIKLAPFAVVKVKSNSMVPRRILKNAMVMGAVASVDTIVITKNSFVGIFRQVTASVTSLGDFTLVNVDGGMVLVPAGDSTFQMGNAAGAANEQPVHAVKFSHDFYMDTVEVTQGSYQALLGKSPWMCIPSTELQHDTAENKAAIYLSWYDAVIYCNARSKHDGLDTVYSYLATGDSAIGAHCKLTGLQIDYSKRGYRLPTEAEWEYACRGGTTTAYYWGNDTVGIGDNAVSLYNSKSLTTASPLYGVNFVGTKLPNAFNLHDMIGNVYELCNDFFNATYYGGAAPVDPTGPATGTSRVYRGGSWKWGMPYLTSSCRAAFDLSMNSTGLTDAGFRCVIIADK